MKLKLLQKKKVIPSQKRHTRTKGYLKDNVQLLTLALPTVILLSIFAYWPMFGIVLAFKDYKVPKGIWGSPWVGFKNFEFFLKSQDAWRVTRNTIVLNLLFIVVGIVCGVIFALIMFEVKKARHVKIYQTVSIIPSFISWVAVGYIVYAMLDPTKGMVNQLLALFGKEGISWYSEPQYWPFILVITKTWQGVGLGSIIYYAALMGVDNELYEAADIDGAGKLQKTWFVSIPQIVPIIIIMGILDIGKIFRADFGLFYNVTRDVGALYPKTDVIDTYVFRALMQQGNLGMSAAVGLFQSVICFVTLMLTNAIIKKKSPENALF
ncbi:ABC transporter permease [Lachnoclostridium sp.]|uniref:ABC transporter permease n=1 Tax=Lachnoclostridium sp. TaxID=2028282 RepID=UPI00289923E5|nr:ABC transporter permease subunit [Lachnoclostridium sp.]